MPHFDLSEVYRSPCSSLEGLRIFFALYFFCLYDMWPSTQQHRPLVELVLTWLSGDHPEGSSEDKVRGLTCVLLKSPVPTSLLACHPMVWSPDPLLVCTTRLSSLRRFCVFLATESLNTWYFEWVKVLEAFRDDKRIAFVFEDYLVEGTTFSPQHCCSLIWFGFMWRFHHY